MSDVKVKGVALRADYDWIVRVHGAETWERIAENMDEEPRIALETASPALWYPIKVAESFNTACAKAMNVGDSTVAAGPFFEQMGHGTAEDNLTGIYALFMRLVTPERIFAQMPRVWSTYFEGIQAKVVMTGDTAGTVIVEGLDVPYVAPTIVGGIKFAMEKAGSPRANVVERSWAAGKLHNDPLEFDVSW